MKLTATVSRRQLVARSSKLALAIGGAIGLTAAVSSPASASYKSHVIANGRPVRSGPGTGFSIIDWVGCGDSFIVNEHGGFYACSCNECTTLWVYNGTGYIHRGNMNITSACECP